MDLNTELHIEDRCVVPVPTDTEQLHKTLPDNSKMKIRYFRAYRPPPPTTPKSSFGGLLSPTLGAISAPTERTALLTVSQSSFCNAREQSWQGELRHNSNNNNNNNNVHGQLNNNNNNICSTLLSSSEQESQRLACLAQTLANAVGTAVVAERHDDGEISEACSLTVQSNEHKVPSGVVHKKPPISADNSSMRACPRSNYSLPETDALRSDTASAASSSAVQQTSPARSFLMRESLQGSPFCELSGSVQMDEQPIAEQLELQLVESWKIDDQTAVGDEQFVRHKDTLERLADGRRLGTYLAERLAHGLERNERAAARTCRQRNSLLDALISALIASEEVEDGGGGEPCRAKVQLNNKMRQLSTDQQTNGKKNGLLRSAEDGGRWSPALLCRKKSRSMDLSGQQQQQQPRVGAVQTATQPNGCVLNSESDSHGTGLYPLSTTSSSIGWRRRRRSCEARGYVPLRESECEPSGDETNEEEEDVVFL